MAHAVADAADPQTYACASGGFRLPIRYRGVRSLFAAFTASHELLQRLLPADVVAQRVDADRGLLVTQFVDMPHTTIGPYQECTIGIPIKVRSGWDRPAANVIWAPSPGYVVWLPVTTARARDSGQAIWGYPKTIAEVDFITNEQTFSGRVATGGKLLIECQADLEGEQESGTIQLRSLGLLRGSFCRTTIVGSCVYRRLAQPSSCELRIHPGMPVTDALLALELDRTAVDAAYISDFDYELVAPVLASASSDAAEPRRGHA